MSSCLDSEFFIHKPYAIGKLHRHIKIMSRHEDRLFHLMCKRIKQKHDFHFAWIIQESCRFVKEYHGSLLCECFGNHDFLTFSVTEALHHPVSERFYACQGNGIIHSIFIPNA